MLASRATFRPSMENQETRGEDGHAASRCARIRARHAHWSRRDRRVGRTGSMGARGFPMEGPSGNDRWFPLRGTRRHRRARIATQMGRGRRHSHRASAPATAAPCFDKPPGPFHPSRSHTLQRLTRRGCESRQVPMRGRPRNYGSGRNMLPLGPRGSSARVGTCVRAPAPSNSTMTAVGLAMRVMITCAPLNIHVVSIW